MAEFAILRIARLKTFGNLSASVQHCFRERDTPNANPELLHKNEVTGAASSEAVIAAVRSRIDSVDVKDKQAIPCIEYFIGASPGSFRQEKAPIMERDYFDDSLEWIKRKHGAGNVVCSVIHRDESTPHMTVYVVPIVQREARTRKRSVAITGGGRGVKEFAVPAQSELSAKHFFGGREKMVQLQTDFAKQVGEEYGLDRGKHRTTGDERVTHTTLKEWYATMDKQKKEIEALRVDLEASRVKVEKASRSLDAERANLVKERQQLERDIAGHADDLKHLERVSRGQANIKAGLDQREVALAERDDFLERKKEEINGLYRQLKVDVAGVAKTLLERDAAIKAAKEAKSKDRGR